MTIETVTSETLAAFNAGKLGLTELQELADKPKEAPKADEVATEVVDEASKEEEKPKKVNKLESRFSEITEARRKAEEERDAMRKERDELKAQLKPKDEPAEAKDEVSPKPKRADYTDQDKYEEDIIAWGVNKALKEKEAKEATDKVVNGWKSRVEAAKLRYPDFDDMLRSSKASVSDPAKDTLLESEYGPDIVYALSEDDDLAEKVTKMKPADQVKWIGRMETTYEKAAQAIDAKKEEEEKPAVKERPRAPAPITPVRGAKADSLDDTAEFKGSFSEYKAQRRKQMA